MHRGHVAANAPRLQPVLAKPIGRQTAAARPWRSNEYQSSSAAHGTVPLFHLPSILSLSSIN